MTERLQAEFDQLSQLPEAEQDRFAQLIRDLKLRELRWEIRDGIESGPATPLDMEEIKREARDSRLRELIRLGRARPPAEKVFPPDFWKRPRPHDSPGRSLAAVREERDEGR